MNLQERCTWCGGPADDDDHVFPRCLGGTLEMALLACRSCQAAIGAAERDVAHHSILGVARLNDGPAPRDRRRPGSGALHPVFMMTKDPLLGGYTEAAALVGGVGKTLPSLEINVETGQMRRRGDVVDHRRLVEAIRKRFAGPPAPNGLVAEIHCPLLTEEPFASDADWWPRVFLDVADRLVVRARTPEEAGSLMGLVLQFVGSPRADDYTGWQTGEILAGSHHTTYLYWRRYSIERVAAKVACGVLAWMSRPGRPDSEQLDLLRRFARGLVPGDQVGGIEMLTLTGADTVMLGYNVCAIQRVGPEIVATVVLAGSALRVALGPTPPGLDLPAVAVSRRDGTRTRVAGEQETRGIVEALRDLADNVTKGSRLTEQGRPCRISAGQVAP